MNGTFQRYLVIPIVLSTVLAVTTAAAEGGCKLQGSWIGVEGGELLVTYGGQSSSSGTADEDLPALDPTFFGLCPGAVKISSLRGLWERTGGNKFIYTEVGYVVDDLYNVICIVKNSGDKTLSDKCNLMTVESTLELFAPGTDPFEDDPFFGMRLDTVYAYRMRIDPPYVPLD